MLNVIPHSLIEGAEKIFSKQTVMKAKQLLQTGRISVSFNKERESRFVVSVRL